MMIQKKHQQPQANSSQIQKSLKQYNKKKQRKKKKGTKGGSDEEGEVEAEWEPAFFRLKDSFLFFCLEEGAPAEDVIDLTGFSVRVVNEEEEAGSSSDDGEEEEESDDDGTRREHDSKAYLGTRVVQRLGTRARERSPKYRDRPSR